MLPLERSYVTVDTTIGQVYRTELRRDPVSALLLKVSTPIDTTEASTAARKET